MPPLGSPPPLWNSTLALGVFDLNLEGNFQSLWTQVARIYGIETVFDTDLQPGPQLHFRLDQADYREAMHSLESATGDFVTPVSSTVIIIAKDTPAKRNDLEQNITVSISVRSPPPRRS